MSKYSIFFLQTLKSASKAFFHDWSGCEVSSCQLQYPALGWRAGRAASHPYRGHSILLLLLLLHFPFSSSFSSPPLPPPLLCSLLRVAATVPERPRPAPEDKKRRVGTGSNRWRRSKNLPSHHFFFTPTLPLFFHISHLCNPPLFTQFPHLAETEIFQKPI